MYYFLLAPPSWGRGWGEVKEREHANIILACSLKKFIQL
jgi:hypothetical protein